MTAPHAPIALGRPVGPGHPPWIVAELSANHLGDLARAHAIVDAAAAAGCDAIKFQTFTPASMTLAGDGPGFRIERGPWAGRTLWDLYEEAHLPWAWHGELFAHARAVGLVPFSTPFDPDAVAALGELAPLVWKIASFEAGDDELIAACAATGRPIILSTGMASDDEVAHAVAAARGHGCRELILLHCVSGYPTPPEQMNLRRLTTLARLAPVGLSDHSPGAGGADRRGRPGRVRDREAPDPGAGPTVALTPDFPSSPTRWPRSCAAVAPPGPRSVTAAPPARRSRPSRAGSVARCTRCPISRSASRCRAPTSGRSAPGMGWPRVTSARCSGGRPGSRFARGTPLAWELVA
jgi:hypothetical protein